MTLDLKLKDSGLAIMKGSSDTEMTATLNLDNDGWQIVEVPRCPPLTTFIVRYHYNKARAEVTDLGLNISMRDPPRVKQRHPRYSMSSFLPSQYNE